jgi:hypothetical protein
MEDNAPANSIAVTHRTPFVSTKAPLVDISQEIGQQQLYSLDTSAIIMIILLHFITE